MANQARSDAFVQTATNAPVAVGFAPARGQMLRSAASKPSFRRTSVTLKNIGASRRPYHAPSPLALGRLIATAGQCYGQCARSRREKSVVAARWIALGTVTFADAAFHLANARNLHRAASARRGVFLQVAADGSARGRSSLPQVPPHRRAACQLIGAARPSYRSVGASRAMANALRASRVIVRGRDVGGRHAGWALPKTNTRKKIQSDTFRAFSFLKRAATHPDLEPARPSERGAPVQHRPHQGTGCGGSIGLESGRQSWRMHSGLRFIPTEGSAGMPLAQLHPVGDQGYRPVSVGCVDTRNYRCVRPDRAAIPIIHPMPIRRGLHASRSAPKRSIRGVAPSKRSSSDPTGFCGHHQRKPCGAFGSKARDCPSPGTAWRPNYGKPINRSN